MKEITFQSENAQRVYKNYIRSVEKLLKPLSEADKQDLLMEVNSHIYEGMQNYKGMDETENLLNIIDKLGSPDEYVKPAVAYKKVQEASRTFNPGHVIAAIFLNLRNGVVYLVLSILYLFLIVLLGLSFVDVFIPEQTGLFLSNGEFTYYGMIKDPSAYTEVLGYWFIPLNLGICAVLYFLITLIFRFIKKK